MDFRIRAGRLARVPHAGGDSDVMALRLPRRAARRPACPVIATAAVVISLGLFAAGCAGAQCRLAGRLWVPRCVQKAPVEASGGDREGERERIVADVPKP